MATNIDQPDTAIREHWSVVVSRNGEQIVTIELNLLCGREPTVEDERVIETAARHLLGFIGK